MKLHDLQPAEGSRQPRTRVGRGIAAGKGKTAGRGTKGQKARAGGSIPAWFEGGQTPLHMRIPKLRGFKNRFKIEYEVVNVGAIGALAERGAFEVEAQRRQVGQGRADHGQPGHPARRRSRPDPEQAAQDPGRRRAVGRRCSWSPTRSPRRPEPRSRPPAAASTSSRCRARRSPRWASRAEADGATASTGRRRRRRRQASGQARDGRATPAARRGAEAKADGKPRRRRPAARPPRPPRRGGAGRRARGRRGRAEADRRAGRCRHGADRRARRHRRARSRRAVRDRPTTAETPPGDDA